MRHIAVILAGGIGSRVGGSTPKQLLPLADGRSILEHCVDAFEAAPSIDEIAVVMHSDHMIALQQICKKNAWHKLTKIIPGGSERWQSSYNAIQAFKGTQDASIWLHDAARPFISEQIIANVARALETHQAVTVAVPVTDTLYRTSENVVQNVCDRSNFMRAQTPQAFHIDVISDAFEKALLNDTFIATDDVAILRQYRPDIPVFIVPGEESNRKITYKEDIQ